MLFHSQGFFPNIIILILLRIQSIIAFQIFEQYPFSYSLNNGEFLIMTQKGFRLYDYTLHNLKNSYEFNPSTVNIQYKEDISDYTSVSDFPNGIIIALVKRIFFVFDSNLNKILENDLSAILGDGKYYQLTAHKRQLSLYYFIISYYDSTSPDLGPFSIKYFCFSTDTTTSITNPIAEITYIPINSEGNQCEIQHYGLSCKFMIKNSQEVFTCFYQVYSPPAISVTSFEISETTITPIEMDRIYSSNDQVSMIKSAISPDKTKALICYTKYATISKCFRYDITTNQFTTPKKYFDACSFGASGMSVLYFKEKDEYMFICYDNDKGFSIVKFDSNFQDSIPNSEGNTIPYYQFGKICYYIYSFNIVYLYYIDDYILINDCNLGDGVFTSFSINLDRIANKENDYPIREEVDIAFNKVIRTLPIITDENTDEETDTEFATETDTEVATETDSEVATQTDTQIATETDTQAATETNTEVATETDTQEATETDSEVATETDTQTPTQTDSEVATETDTQAASETNSEVATETDTQTPTQTDSTQTATQTDTQATSETDTQTVTEENNSSIHIIYQTSTKSKEEMVSNLEDIINDKDPEDTYVISGDDYTIIIRPVNEIIEDSTVNIDFSECEKELKEKFPSKQFRILQINMENNNEKCISDQVEYKIYDENGDEMDLSICEEVDIKIEYKITNTSLLNLEQISNFINKGIDVFNINSDFFNDICYSYTDDSSGSDLILSDRVSDIYQNYSICGSECEYKSFNLEKLSANCNCKVKQAVNTESEKGNFKSYIVGAFLDSNFGVVTCFNLVFSLKGKIKNAGFLIFGAMIISHIPINIVYFINGISPVIKYINLEMDSKGYKTNQVYKTSKSKKKQNKRKESNRKNLEGNNHGKEPKRKKHKKRLNENPPRRKRRESVSLDGDNLRISKNPKNKKFQIETLSNEGNKNLNNKIKGTEKNNAFENILKIKAKKRYIFRNNKQTNDSFDNGRININNNNLKKNFTTMESNKTQSNSFEKHQKKKHKKSHMNLNKLDENDEKNKSKKIKTKKFSQNYLLKNYNNNVVNSVESGAFLIPKSQKKLYNTKLTSKVIKQESNKRKWKNIFQTTEDENIQKNNERRRNEIPLILINANNIKNPEPFKSNYVLNNYDFNEAILYDNRNFCRIFFILLISKEKILNIIFFNPPLELKPLRIGIFIFSFACDLALNALFYLSDNISDKYHYTGAFKELYTLANNLTKSIISSLVSMILLAFFQSLVQSSNGIEDLFRKQEELLKADKKYKVSDETKNEIRNKINSILKCLKVKIIIFIIFETIFMLFFFYYATAFCQVYPNTQISWLLDNISSYLFSFIFATVLSFILACLYKLAIKNKTKALYKIIIFTYSF